MVRKGLVIVLNIFFIFPGLTPKLNKSWAKVVILWNNVKYNLIDCLLHVRGIKC
jgi:hypothetical protein